ncbi:phosphoacetylglucosamine mutase-like protein, partial [Leptotrombidium deliense]
PTEEGYYAKLSKAFLKTNFKPISDELVIDCANGVGAQKLKKLIDYFQENTLFKPNLCNIGDGILNHNCGADFVKIRQGPPDGILLKPDVRYASFDGDADRIVYYYVNPITSKFCLVDGDKIAILFMLHLKDLFEKLDIANELDFCIVQTAYANGNSTQYIRNVLKVETDCVATGVKNLHHRAKQADVGVYFEANGHGTALISKKTINLINNLQDSQEKQLLLNFIDLINQTSGDAISDLLVVETILNNRQLSIHEWNSLYSDLPSKQLKVKVADRSVIKTTCDETKCTAPLGLQEIIDSTVSKYGPKARAFVRPSGTEDVVRVYAETETQEKTDQLANQIAEIIKQQLS